jgi:16S rRNA C1402 (ribose-2'-O) methylase RsmI
LAAKPIGNKSDNTLKKMSENTLKTKSEWQHIQKVSTTTQKCEHYNSRKRLQEYHEKSSWENREKLDWV